MALTKKCTDIMNRFTAQIEELKETVEELQQLQERLNFQRRKR